MCYREGTNSRRENLLALTRLKLGATLQFQASAPPLNDFKEADMNNHRSSESLTLRGVALAAAKAGAVAIGALAIGAVAVGAFAIGALSIGRLAAGRLVVNRAKFKSLDIEELNVTRLHVREITVSDSLQLPEHDSPRTIEHP